MKLSSASGLKEIWEKGCAYYCGVNNKMQHKVGATLMQHKGHAKCKPPASVCKEITFEFPVDVMSRLGRSNGVYC